HLAHPRRNGTGLSTVQRHPHPTFAERGLLVRAITQPTSPGMLVLVVLHDVYSNIATLSLFQPNVGPSQDFFPYLDAPFANMLSIEQRHLMRPGKGGVFLQLDCSVCP